MELSDFTYGWIFGELHAIKERIEAALRRNAQLEAHRIRVEVRGDRVILTGNVLSWVEREEAERAAWASTGVCNVENLLLVNPVSNLVAH